jgi:hypothetical protein
MDRDTLQAAFQTTLGDQVHLVPESEDQYSVLSPFQFDDGDLMSIVLRREGGRWVLSDEGTTYMHLSYDLDEKDLERGNRARIIANTLSAFGLEDRSGELILPVSEGRWSNALFDFAQALSRIANVTYLNRERVRQTFLQDLRYFVAERIPEDRRTWEWHDPKLDPEVNYPVDVRIEGAKRPIFLFGLQSDDKVNVATITLHQFERWSVPNLSIGVFEDQSEVGRKTLARFTDIVDKQFSNLHGNRDRLAAYLDEAVETPAG